MAAYFRRYRRCKAQVRALAEPSSESSPNSSGDELNTSFCSDIPNFVNENIQGSDNNLQDIYFDDVFSGNVGAVSGSDSDNDFMYLHYANDLNEPEKDFGEELADWAVRNRCTRASLNELLDILRKQGHRLPKDARTLLHTPRLGESEKKCNGDYSYFGIESGVLKILAQNPMYSIRCNTIELLVNVDGVPLCKSNNRQLWPILCSFGSFTPFIVALYCGVSKPDNISGYLKDFITEYQRLRQNGITYSLKTLQVTIKAFVCDAPARAFLKCTKNHNSYYSCERCVIKGEWEGRIVFNSTEISELRTEADFERVLYDQYQLSKSPLVDAGISCVRQFPLDYMHLVCLGIVRRMIYFLKGNGPRDCKLSQLQLGQISAKLCLTMAKCQVILQDRWKATEFRQFVLYTGPVVLRQIVSKDVYKHFLCLTVILSILLNSNDTIRDGYLDYCRKLIVYFVRKGKYVYGSTFTTYNVHSFLHIADDVENFGCSLNDISAFPFENYLQTLKKYVRNSSNPVSQISKRLVEFDKSKTKSGPGGSSHVKHFISTKKRDCCFLLFNNDFAFVKEIRCDGTFVCDIIRQDDLENFFVKPCKSKTLNICFVKKLDHLTKKRKLLVASDFYRKVVCLPYEEGHVLFPLLHEMERN